MTSEPERRPQLHHSAGIVRRNGFEVGRQERRRSASHRRDRQGRRSGRAVFAKRFQTTNSPVHRAVWDRGVPVELFRSTPQPTPPEVSRVMEDSLAVAQKHVAGRHAAQRRRTVSESVLDELGEVGYWGLLVDKKYGGSGAPFARFAPFLTKMAMVDATVAGLASVHGCIGAVDPVRTFGSAEQKQRFLPDLAQRQAAVGVRPDRAVCRLGSDGAAHHGRRSTATTMSSTARSCSSPTSFPAGRSAWCA